MENIKETLTGENIRKQAKAYSEASVYVLNNEYLTTLQKTYVEGIYQLPGGVFVYALLGYIVFVEPRAYVNAIIFAGVLNSVATILIWFSLNETIARIGGIIFGGSLPSIICLSLAVYMGYQNEWIGFLIGITSASGLTSLIEPSTYLFSILSPSPMHPKYMIAKKLYNIRFPFEDYLVAVDNNLIRKQSGTRPEAKSQVSVPRSNSPRQRKYPYRYQCSSCNRLWGSHSSKLQNCPECQERVKLLGENE